MTEGTIKQPNTKLSNSVIAAGLATMFKGKWLLVSFASMFVSIFVFAQRDGFAYGFALVMLILVHEAGHWMWMKALGLNPKAPMFIPGLGAFVSMQKAPTTEALHAWIALAGPLVGGLGCVLLFAIGVHTNNSWLMTSSNTGFMLNVMQLIPAHPLDGGFIVRAISRWLLIPGTIVLFILAFLTGASLLWVIAIVSLLSWKRPPVVVRPPAPSVDAEGNAAIPEEPVVTAPATAWEKFAIGVAYLSLIGALMTGFIISQSEVSH